MYKLILIVLIFLNNEDKKNNLLQVGIQFTSGVLAGSLFTYSLFKIFPIQSIDRDVAKIDAEQMIFNVTVGLTLGSYFGVIISGKIMKSNGNNSKAFLGSFLGFLAGAGAFAYLSETFKGRTYENISFVPLFIFPSFGATVGYNFKNFKK
ncbi:MAG: hypothetical protein ABIM85_01345, partial [candidate division WOR-3 bacterium]